MSCKISLEVLQKTLNEISPNPMNNIENETLKITGEEAELIYILQHMLQTFKFPISISFLNTSFSGWGKKNLITFDFLKNHNDLFTICVIGSDLKIMLLSNSNTKYKLKNIPEFTKQLEQILEKDVDKCKKLKYKLTEGMLFEEVIKQFSSHKYKMNLGFCVRNSHVVNIYVENGETYLKLIEDFFAFIDMNEKEIWDCVEKGVDMFVVECLKNLLDKIAEPINQGTLQSLMNFGIPIVDKLFLKNHCEIFKGGGDDGVMLSSSHRSYQLVNKSKIFTKSPPKITNHYPESFNLNSDTNTTSVSSEASEILSIKAALNERQSIVVIGGDSEKPPFIVEAKDTTKSEQLLSLMILRGYIDVEIEKRK